MNLIVRSGVYIISVLDMWTQLCDIQVVTNRQTYRGMLKWSCCIFFSVALEDTSAPLRMEVKQNKNNSSVNISLAEFDHENCKSCYLLKLKN